MFRANTKDRTLLNFPTSMAKMSADTPGTMHGAAEATGPNVDAYFGCKKGQLLAGRSSTTETRHLRECADCDAVAVIGFGRRFRRAMHDC